MKSTATCQKGTGDRTRSPSPESVPRPLDVGSRDPPNPTQHSRLPASAALFAGILAVAEGSAARHVDRSGMGISRRPMPYPVVACRRSAPLDRGMFDRAAKLAVGGRKRQAVGRLASATAPTDP